MSPNEKSSEATGPKPAASAEGARRTAAMPVSLTPRESEVLAWVTEGKRDAEIASILGASINTIHKHVQRILAKLGVETRTAAAKVALDGARIGTDGKRR